MAAEIRKRKQNKSDVPKCDDVNSGETSVNTEKLRYGPLPRFPNQRVWTRCVLALCVTAVIYFTAHKGKERILASQTQNLERRGHDIACSESFTKEISAFQGCIPKTCGRMVSDTLISKAEVETLLNIARQGLALGGSDGGASILDLHSGALSQGQAFINFYKHPEAVNILKAQDFLTYKIVRTKIQQAIAQHFGIRSDNLFLTHPTFFSRLTNASPKTVHDEYWHKHVDKETYESFHYTSLLYLNDYKRDFEGGRFVFVEVDNSTAVVEPRRGRVSAFTSGEENPHLVERVTSGTRYAVTVSFTCDSRKGIADPQAKQQ